MSSEDERDEGNDGPECECEVSVHGNELVVDAEACAGDGRLADRPGCRETVIDALSHRDVTTVCMRSDDVERTCSADAAALLLAAGRFVALCSVHEPQLAARARRDPLAAARLAAARSDPISRIAAETGLLEGAVRFGSYREVFRGRTIAHAPDGRRDTEGATEPSRSGTGIDRAERTARVLDIEESDPPS